MGMLVAIQKRAVKWWQCKLKEFKAF